MTTESTTPPHPQSIVCLFSQRDEPFYRELQTHLIQWQNKGYIRWLELSPGADIGQTLLSYIQQADLILLLVSPSFFASSTCHKAMDHAFAERTTRAIPIVPILARACDWQESDCANLSILPENELPIAEWEHQERAYEHIRSGLAHLIPSLSTQSVTLPIRPRLFQARDLPKSYVPRPKAFDSLKTKLLAQHRAHNTTAITTALRGAGGFGKTTLALALCHDPEIQATFPDGILWIELGEQPPRTLDLLNTLLASLETSYIAVITLEEARSRWRTVLQDRVLLLVIDDVWQAQALLPLLEGGPQCLRLVTTRNDQLLPEDAERVWVDAMEPQEALSVLYRGLPEESQQAKYQPTFESLAKRLGYWPLLLSLAHGMLTTLVSFGQSIADALNVVEEAYQTRGVTAFHLGHANERQQTADACLDVSLRHLEEFTHSHYHAATRYQELAVFPEDTDIPLTTLQIFWKGTDKMEAWETKDLCMQLHRLSLLLTCDLSKGTIRLHDVLRSYLVQRADPHLPALHIHLLDAHQQILSLKCWSALPPDHHYIWQYLVYHLCHSSRIEELQSTFTDLGYLARKALYVSVSALEADLLSASIFHHATTTKSPSSFFTSLHRSIVRISHLLRQAHTPSEMGGLLLSHLGWEPSFTPQRLSLERELPRPFLTSWHPLPVGSSSSLIRTLHGHTNGVSGCAVSGDGKWIVSASSDKTLKVWDVATGEERQTLIGHTDRVSGCAVSGDGRWIVSASDDKTLKMWDAETGREWWTMTGHIDEVNGCAVSGDGRWVVSVSLDKTLKMWDVAIGRCILTFPVDGALNGCAFHPDGEHLVACGDQGVYFLRLVV